MIRHTTSTSPTLPLDSVWAIEPNAAEQLTAAANALGPEALRIPRGLTPGLPLEVVDGIAIVDVAGPLTKRPSIFQIIFGGSSTDQIREAVQQATVDDSIRGILLRVDSPGGSTAGLAELGDAVFAARLVKPVIAQVETMCASAALYVASQASQIFAGRMDMVGSIGTRMMLYDFSGLFSKRGIKAVPIDTGEYKSAAALGTEITEAQQAHFQHIVDCFFDDFLAAVQRGRGMSAQAVRSVADGRMFVAGEAVANQLIDGIQTFEQTLAQLVGRATSPPSISRRKETMRASFEEITSACPGADAEFICQQLSRQATADDARTAWSSTQQTRITDQQLQLEARAEAAGVQPLPMGRTVGSNSSGRESFDGDDAVGEFNDRVEKRMAGGMPRRQAVLAVAKQDPELHHAFVSATNSDGQRVQNLIDERFAG